jgi:hypothetical protein
MQDPFVKSATRGLILSHVCLGLAGTGALVLFSALAFTQWYGLVVVVPIIALACVTVGVLYLLRRDDVARRKNNS